MRYARGALAPHPAQVQPLASRGRPVQLAKAAGARTRGARRPPRARAHDATHAVRCWCARCVHLCAQGLHISLTFEDAEVLSCAKILRIKAPGS